MSDVQVISVERSFFKGLNEKQQSTFEKIIEQNKFLRESVVGVEESATDRVATLNAELEDADNTIDKLEVQVADLKVEVSKMKSQNEDLLVVVDTATESAKLSMKREAQVNKDAELMLKEKMETMDSKVSQAEFNMEQRYTALLYEIQDEKDVAESRVKELEAELASTLVIVEHKTEANTSLTKQVQQLEETKSELEEIIDEIKKEINNDTIETLREELKIAVEQNTESKDALSRIKWRSKEEIDAANCKVTELQQSLSALENEQQLVSAELVRVMQERDSLEAELSSSRLNYQQKRNSGDISDLESLSGGSVEMPMPPTPPHVRQISASLGPSFKYSLSPRSRQFQSDRSIGVSEDGRDGAMSPAPLSVSYDDHKAKLTEKQSVVEDTKRKNYILMEEMENLRKQHTELIENNMLERKNREKLLKAAQKELSVVQKEYKHCQKYASSLEKELSEYLAFHKRQTEIKDTTISVHKELAKSRTANADLAKQLLEMNKAESATQQLNADLQNEVNMLLNEISNLHNELDANATQSSKWNGNSYDSDSDSDSTEDDDDDDEVFSNRSSTGTQKKRTVGRNSSSSSSSSNYDTLKQMYLATALDSMEKQRRSGSSPSKPNNRKSKSTPKLQPRSANTNLNNHYSPSPL